VTSGLEDFALDELLDLGHLVLLGAVKLVGLTSGAVVVKHLLESGTNVNGVDGVEAFLHVVGCEHVGCLCDAVEQTVLEAEHGGRADDCCLGEDVADSLLSAGLGTVELGGRVQGGRVRGNVNEAVNIVLGDGIGDAGGTLDVDVLEVEVLGGVVATDQVVDNVRVTDRLVDGSRVAEIHFLLCLSARVGAKGQVWNWAYKEDNTAQVTGDLEMALGHLLAEGDDDGASGTGYGLSLALEQARRSRECVPSLLTT
jgi:hypothetical protein